MAGRGLIVGLPFLFVAPHLAAQPPQPTRTPLVRAVDLALMESTQVELCDGEKVVVKLLEVKETSDPVREAVRSARVKIEVDGRAVWLESANYELPRTVGKVRVDCPIVRGYLRNSHRDPWQLKQDARLRLWPAGSPLVVPGTFVYPVKQRFFASATQMANEPCYVNACDRPSVRKIYYHNGLDFGGCEGMTEVVSATDGLVVSRGVEQLPGYEQTPVRPRHDVVYVLDSRGWYYRYSHLYEIDEAIRHGATVRAGQRIGLIGKEGGSGGWAHLHFDVSSLQPSGEWGTQEAYAFVWEAYGRQYEPKLIAVARPHHLTFVGEQIVLDGSRSWSAAGENLRYDWAFTDGTTAQGKRVERAYSRAGYYSEVLRVTDSAGRVNYDFAIVHVLDRDKPEPMPPTIHPVYEPTMGIRPGIEVTFKVRTFATTDGEETWDFGDGSPTVNSKSDGNVESHAVDGYAVVTHRYQVPGQYLVRVHRTDRLGRRAVGYLHVPVAEAARPRAP